MTRRSATGATSAAIFDLDRTLLRGASTPALRRALASVGLVSERGLPGEGVLLRIYEALGESIPHMALARLAAFACAGWPVATAARAGELAAGELVKMVAPYASELLEEHRRQGRLLVLATTTPEHMVAPFAASVGFDAVVATRYQEREGAFTGRLDGHFVWSRFKLDAIKSWASSEGVSLKHSFAYSDSFYDLPLLGAVGHPFVVNPDARLRAIATVRRWPVLHLDVPPGVPKIAGVEPFSVVARLATEQMLPFARFYFSGVGNIPREGGVIVAANHRSYFDVAAVGLLAVKAGRPLRFLAKKEVTDAPVVGWLARAMGSIRVDRESPTGEPLEAAARAVRAGEAVGIFPQGTIPRGRAFFEPQLVARTGVARLAAATGALIVPVGIWGTEKVWPRSARIPRITQVRNPPVVSVAVGEPIPASRLPGDPRKAAAAVMEAIVGLLPESARLPYEPTEEEVRSATPPGGAG